MPARVAVGPPPSDTFGQIRMKNAVQRRRRRSTHSPPEVTDLQGSNPSVGLLKCLPIAVFSQPLPCARGRAGVRAADPLCRAKFACYMRRELSQCGAGVGVLRLSAPSLGFGVLVGLRAKPSDTFRTLRNERGSKSNTVQLAFS